MSWWFFGWACLTWLKGFSAPASAFEVQTLCPVGSGERWCPGLVLENPARRDPGFGSWEGWKGDRRQDRGRWGVSPRSPMIGLVLNADEMIVRKTVGARMVLGLHRSLPVPHHHV